MLTKDEVAEAVTKALEESWPGAAWMTLTPVYGQPAGWLVTFNGDDEIPDSFSIQIHSGDTIETVKDRVRLELEEQKKAKS